MTKLLLANPRVNKLLQRAYDAVGIGDTLKSTQDLMYNFCVDDDDYKHHFLYRSQFNDTVKKFLENDKQRWFNSTNARTRLLSLTKKQKKIDVDHNGCINEKDFAILRKSSSKVSAGDTMLADLTTYDFGDGKGRVSAHQHSNGGGWVADTAHVSNTARVAKNAKVFGSAVISGNAKILDRAHVCGNARVYGNAKIFGYTVVSGNALVYEDSNVYGYAEVSGNAKVYGDAQVFGDAWVSQNAQVYGNAWVCGRARVSGNARVSGTAKVSGDTELSKGTWNK